MINLFKVQFIYLKLNLYIQSINKLFKVQIIYLKYNLFKI